MLKRAFVVFDIIQQRIHREFKALLNKAIFCQLNYQIIFLHKLNILIQVAKYEFYQVKFNQQCQIMDLDMN